MDEALPNAHPEREGTESHLDSEKNVLAGRENSLIRIHKLQPGPLPFIAAAICLILAVFLAVIPFRVLALSGFSAILNNGGQLMYTGLTTIFAGLVSAFVVGQTKSLWTTDILYISTTDTLQRQPKRHNFLTRLAAATTKKPCRSSDELRTVIGLANIPEGFTFWPQSLSFLLLGLITTSIVTGMAPNVHFATSPVGQWIYAIGAGSDPGFKIVNSSTSPDANTYLAWPLGNGSWLVMDNETFAAAGLSSLSQTGIPTGQSISQQLPSTLSLLADPLGKATGAMSVDPEGLASSVAYTIQEVAIRPGALGLPAMQNQTNQQTRDPQTTTEMDVLEFFGSFDPLPQASRILGPGQVVSSEACLPVLVSNPVRCSQVWNDSIQAVTQKTVEHFVNETVGPNGQTNYKNGTITTISQSFLAMGGGCNATLSPAQGGGWAGTNLCSNVTGKGSFVYGAAQPPQSGVVTASTQTNPLTGSFYASDQTNWTITCEVDIISSLGFRSVTLDYLGQVSGDAPQRYVDPSTNPSFVYSRPFKSLRRSRTQYAISGSKEACTPPSINGSQPSIDTYAPEEILAFVFASIWSQWSSGAANTSGPAILALDPAVVLQANNLDELALFNDSRNFLEDTVGIMVGQEITNAWISAGVSACPSSNPGCSGSYQYHEHQITFPGASLTATSIRMGIAHPAGIVLILPLCYALLLLVWLIRRRQIWAKRQTTAPVKRRAPFSSCIAAIGKGTRHFKDKIRNGPTLAPDTRKTLINDNHLIERKPLPSLPTRKPVARAHERSFD